MLDLGYILELDIILFLGVECHLSIMVSVSPPPVGVGYMVNSSY